ncbi:papain-like cysteine protease family protein [Amphritea japonica]|nr:papain-like cysteine protease family protein [Amphritea japonica]
MEKMKLKGLMRILAMSFIMAHSAISNADIYQLQQNLFVAGIQSGEFDYFASPNKNGRQRQANWCWAASIQMVLNYHGLYVSQEQVVQKIYGGQIDQPANSNQILNALTGWAPDNRGRSSSIYAKPYTSSGRELVQALANKWPLIVGLRNPNGGIGHAVVLTAVYYSVDQFNNPILNGVVLRDPWPGSPSRQKLSWNEFQSRLMFMTQVYVERL